MHLDAEQIERLLHGELDPRQELALRAHVGSCAYCEGRVETARREEEEIVGLLRGIDHPLPDVRAGAVVSRAGWTLHGWGRMAAGIALALVVSGVVYAMPGSPLRGAVRTAMEWISPAAPPAPAPAPPAPPATPRTGVSVLPGADFAIVFASPQAAGAARVRVVESPEIAVHVLGARVPLDLGIDRVTVANAGAEADYEVLLPRAARSLRILVGRSVVLRKEGARIVAAAAADSAGVYTIPLRPR